MHTLVYLLLAIDDGTSTIRVVFGSKNAEKLIGVKAHIIVKLEETLDYNLFLENKSNELLGRDIILKGKAILSDFPDFYLILDYALQDNEISV